MLYWMVKETGKKVGNQLEFADLTEMQLTYSVKRNFGGRHGFDSKCLEIFLSHVKSLFNQSTTDSNEDDKVFELCIFPKKKIAIETMALCSIS